MRILGCIGFVGAILFLAGCGIFFAPVLGHWNPADPASVEEATELTAAEALWVGETGSGSPDTATLYVGKHGGEEWAALLDFDFASLPREIMAARLELQCTSENGVSFAAAVRIVREPWDTKVGWPQVVRAGFFSTNSSPAVSLPPTSIGRVQFDVTDLLRSYRESSMHGLLLKAEPAVDGAEATFNSEDVLADPPVLHVWGY